MFRSSSEPGSLLNQVREFRPNLIRPTTGGVRFAPAGEPDSSGASLAPNLVRSLNQVREFRSELRPNLIRPITGCVPITSAGEPDSRASNRGAR